MTFRIFPAPEGGEPSLWLTAAGNPETFRRAGTIGANVLTHLLGQDLDELERKLAVYREARAEAGHDPEAGRVTVMLHTHLGRDAEEVRSRVRGPFRDYLASSVSLLQKAAETWRGFRADGTQTAEAEGDEFESLSEEDREALLEHAFDRYYDTSGLFGTPDACAPLVERLVDAGVDEIACLVDFGVEAEAVLEGLEPLGELRSRFAGIPDAEETSLPAMIERHGVTHLQCTPSLLRLLWSDAGTRSALDDLEVLLVGGEAFPDALASEVRASLDARILNMYGPTETTVWSTTHEVRDVRGPLPIGRPIANTRTYVLDDRRRLLPRGTAGELWIGGPGVARGYRDRPELTAERFVADPFADAPEARIYRTGDRVRWRDDDALAFLGRVDRQVKVRGHRVELGEIEAVLERQDGVRAAAVLLAGDDDPRLVAYVSWRDGRPADPDRTLRAKLREVLPEHMVPARVVSLESMPLTPNRKIDRRALAGSEEASVPREAGGREQTGPADVPRERSDPGRRPPSTPVETRLARIWSETLQLDEVGPEENFFELGGNSLSTIQLARRIRDAFGVELPLRAVFRSPTVRGLAARIEEEIVAGADEDDLGALLDEVGELSDEEARRLLADRGRASGAEGREDG